MYYLLANLCNRMTTKIFDIFRKITLKQKKFSQSDPVLFRHFWKKLQSWSGQNWLQSWSSPIQSWSVLISETWLESSHHLSQRDSSRVRVTKNLDSSRVIDSSHAITGFYKCHCLRAQSLLKLSWIDGCRCQAKFLTSAKFLTWYCFSAIFFLRAKE